MSGPHYMPGGFYVRGEDGPVQTRSASLRLRLEPALLEALKERAGETQRNAPYGDGRGTGASAYVRALIVADLVDAGILEQDGAYVIPALRSQL